jgi:hypothetical protein
MLRALSLALLAAAACAQQAQKAHVHGAASLDLAIEGAAVTALFEAPAEALMGFEHAARTPAEIKKRGEALAKLKAGFGAMVLFPAAARCVWKPVKAEVHVHGAHADVEAEFTAACPGPLNRGGIAFAFSKVFPGIQEVKVQLIGAGRQTGAVIRRDQGTVKLAP